MSADLRLPDPVRVIDLFPEERARLLALLDGLTSEEWQRPTACAGWAVRDVAAHLLGGDLGRLSDRQDDGTVAAPLPWARLVEHLNRLNAEWVAACRRLSPAVIRDLLRWSAPRTQAYFASLDPFAFGEPVSWAGLEPAPVWLDLAREYTERWHHQQHVRDAVGRPGLTEGRFVAPVLATFARALPHTFRDTPSPDGTAVHLRITGDGGGDWAVARHDGRWTLYAGRVAAPVARVTLDQDTAWRLFTRGLGEPDAARAARLEGDPALGRRLLRAVAIIA